jgi:ubiquinone/menaquinone biosynthesis C-methylase UbiE
VVQVTETSESRRAKIPLRLRVKAWWEGHDLELRRRELEKKPILTADKHHKVRYEGPDKEWETARIALMQEVWGPGFAGPGGEERILELVKPLGLNPAMSLLELGAGLGGAARIMADHFGVWVSGLEADPPLAEAGMELSTIAGLAKKAPVNVVDPENLEPQSKAYDCVFSKESLFTVKDKDRLFEVIDLTLKDRGQMLFTDFVLAEPDLSSPAIDAWLAAERVTPRPWALEDYAKVLTHHKLDTRISEDITDETRKQITECWANYMSRVDQTSLDDAMSSALVSEAEMWTRRVKLMEAGDLKVCRILAVKPHSERLLSDW